MNAQIEAADRDLATLAAGDPVVARLRTAPGIGPVTAVAVVATLDAVERCASAHQVDASLGLVPSEQRSGERQHRGRLTQRGNTRMRWLLVEAAWRILRSPRPEVAALRAWAEQIAVRRGKRVAVVALARRLAGVLYALWREGSTYHVPRVRPATEVAVA